MNIFNKNGKEVFHACNNTSWNGKDKNGVFCENGNVEVLRRSMTKALGFDQRSQYENFADEFDIFFILKFSNILSKTVSALISLLEPILIK